MIYLKPADKREHGWFAYNIPSKEESYDMLSVRKGSLSQSKIPCFARYLISTKRDSLKEHLVLNGQIITKDTL